MRWLSLLFFVVPLFAKPLDVPVSARSAILMNAETGAILYEKQAHARSFPASVTKVATALYILDQKKPPFDQMFVVPAEAMKMKNPKNLKESPSFWLELDGTRMGILKGEILSVDALLHGMMMVSGNDAANVLAHSVSGSIPEFLDELNAYLKNLGCKDTHYTNPHGLHDEDHYTTAYDLALMAQRAIQIPKFREIGSSASFNKPRTNKQPQGVIQQICPLIKPNSRYYYSKAIAVKTGFHSNSKNCVLSAAEHEGRVLIAVILGCENRTSRYEDTTRLFEAAFAEQKEKRRLIGPENIFTQSVPTSKTLLHAALTKEISIEYFPAEEPECKAALHWNLPPLPIRKGQKVGEIRVTDSRQRLLQKGDIIALQEVQGSFYLQIKDKITKLFN